MPIFWLGKCSMTDIEHWSLSCSLNIFFRMDIVLSLSHEWCFFLFAMQLKSWMIIVLRFSTTFQINAAFTNTLIKTCLFTGVFLPLSDFYCPRVRAQQLWNSRAFRICHRNVCAILQSSICQWWCVPDDAKGLRQCEETDSLQLSKKWVKN